MTQYTFQRGETISLALDALTGDPLTVSNISAAMKAVAPGRTSAAPDMPVAAAFLIQPRVAEGEAVAGWDLSIPPLVSAALDPGRYVADARLELADGRVIVTDSIALSIKPSVAS